MAKKTTTAQRVKRSDRKRTPAGSVRAQNFWKNLLACMEREKITFKDLTEAGISSAARRGWEDSGGASWLKQDYKRILEKTLRIKRAEDLFRPILPKSIDELDTTQPPQPTPVPSAVFTDPSLNKPYLDMVRRLLESHRRDLTIRMIESLYRDLETSL